MNAPCGQEDCDCGHTIERLVEALERMEPLLQSFDAWCRTDHSGNCQSHLYDKPCSVAVARRGYAAVLAKAEEAKS